MPATTHWGGLEGATVIGTREFEAVGVLIDELQEDLGIAGIFGPAGAGKTFSSQHHLASSRLRAVWPELPQRPGPRQLVLILLQAVTGVPCDGGTRGALEEHLIEALGADPLILVLDEAQRLTHQGFEIVRQIHDHRATRFAVLFVGAEECKAALAVEPMVRSRLGGILEVGYLGEVDVVEAIPRYHAIYEGADPELLLEVNEYCQGQWRRWAIFTSKAARLLSKKKNGTLTKAVADEARRRLGGL